MAQIELQDVCLSYFTLKQETEALREINFTIEAGECISIVGPSGCGKSSLLSLISGMNKPTKGRVLIDGLEVAGPSPHVGYMLQQDHLFEWRDIINNLMVGVEIRKMDRRKSEAKAFDLMKQYGLDGFAKYSPTQLSAGMRQRVALIRTLLTEPNILLLDEPFSALDYQTRLILADEIFKIIQDQGITAILVTHDISEAISMAERVMVMSKRPSTISSVYHIEKEEGETLSPWEKRESGRYNQYFNNIWKELEEHVAISR